jgi:hypothetical protein
LLGVVAVHEVGLLLLLLKLPPLACQLYKLPPVATKLRVAPAHTDVALLMPAVGGALTDSERVAALVHELVPVAVTVTVKLYVVAKLPTKLIWAGWVVLLNVPPVLSHE